MARSEIHHDQVVLGRTYVAKRAENLRDIAESCAKMAMESTNETTRHTFIGIQYRIRDIAEMLQDASEYSLSTEPPAGGG